MPAGGQGHDGDSRAVPLGQVAARGLGSAAVLNSSRTHLLKTLSRRS